MYNSDIDIVIHIHIYMHTDARPSMPSHPYTHVCFYIHPYAHARGYGCSPTQMEPPMRVCASGHPYTPRGTSVDTDAHLYRWPLTPARAQAHAHMRTLPWNLHAHSYIYICAHTYTNIRTQLVVAHVHAAPDARSHAHTHTHMDS